MHELHNISFKLDELNSNYLKQYLNITNFDGGDSQYINYIATKGLILLSQSKEELINGVKRFERRL